MAQATKKKSKVVKKSARKVVSSKKRVSSRSKKASAIKKVAKKKSTAKKATPKKSTKRKAVAKKVAKKTVKKASSKKATAKNKVLSRKTSSAASAKKVVSSKAKKSAKLAIVKKKTVAKKPVKKSSASISAKKSTNRGFKSNSKAVIRKLVTENQEHGLRLAWSFLNKWRIRLEPDEVESVVGAALVEAAIRYDKTKGAHFRTFFFYHLRGMLLKEVSNLIEERKTVKHTPSETLENPALSIGGGQVWQHPLVEVDNPEALMVKKQFARRLWDLCQSLDELEREVIERHFIRDHSLKQIAEELQYCRCHISRVKSKALSTLSRLVPELFAGKSAEVLSARVVMEKKYTGGRGRRKDTAPFPQRETVNKNTKSVSKKNARKIAVNS